MGPFADNFSFAGNTSLVRCFYTEWVRMYVPVDPQYGCGLASSPA